MKPSEMSQALGRICSLAPVIPVLEIEEERDAEPLAEALIEGGLPVIEVTLRTSAALPAISRMSAMEGCTVGAGSLLTPSHVAAARQAGAEFGVSPGASDALINACRRQELPLLPGAATATEIMRLQEAGFCLVKFFPAEAAGGCRALKGLSGPLPEIGFCPTGGISARNAPEYLALHNVCCVGGSWVAPRDAVRSQDWRAIRDLARTAASLAGT